MAKRGEMKLLLVLAWAVLALAACRGAPQPKLHQGYFAYGFETVAFRACNATEVWWVEGGEQLGALIEQYTALADASYAEVYVELRGTTSEPGSYGHLGAYARAFTLTEVAQVGGDAPAGCG